MNETKEAQVSGLLQQGLELYGSGDVARAFLLWNEALALDPDNEEALDYLRDADRRSKPRGEVPGSGNRSIVDDARGLLRAENAEAALELLVSVGTNGRLENEAMIELLRASLYRGYQDELGDMSRIPRLASSDGSDLKNRNLPPTVGFLISMIDGQTPWGDLLSLSGMDRFEVLRALSKMFEAEILEWAS